MGLEVGYTPHNDTKMGSHGMASLILRNFAIPAVPIPYFAEAETFAEPLLPPSLRASLAELLSPL